MIVERVIVLAGLLRSEGFAVSTSEVVDATEALRHLDLVDKTVVRACMRSAMVKRTDPLAVFDRCFEIAFQSAHSQAVVFPPSAAQAEMGLGSAPEKTEPGGISGGLLRALLLGDQGALAALARQAAELYAAPDGPANERKAMHRAVRALDLSQMLSQAMRELRSVTDANEFELALRRREISALIEEFRRRLATEIHANRREDETGDAQAPLGRLSLEDAEMHELQRSDYEELRRVLEPLMRQMAASVARRRKRQSTGRLDPRATIRRSMQAGGVPFDVVQRRRHPSRPDIVILCDVSGSVAEFARFTFSFVQAVHRQVGRVRSFAFVDGVAEVTDVFREARFEIPVARLVDQEGVVGPEGHSDYGAAFSEFSRLYLDGSVGRATTVVVSGDARSNYRDGGEAEFKRIAEQARRVYWLNPEPASLWGTTDSLMEAYGKVCTAVHEVRTLRQLADAVSSLI